MNMGWGTNRWWSRGTKFFIRCLCRINLSLWRINIFLLDGIVKCAFNFAVNNLFLPCTRFLNFLSNIEVFHHFSVLILLLYSFEASTFVPVWIKLELPTFRFFNHARINFSNDFSQTSGSPVRMVDDEDVASGWNVNWDHPIPIKVIPEYVNSGDAENDNSCWVRIDLKDPRLTDRGQRLLLGLCRWHREENNKQKSFEC